MSDTLTSVSARKALPAIDVRAMLAAPVLMAGFVILCGAPLGLLWAKLSPHVTLEQLQLSPERSLKNQATVDLWFWLITGSAGIILGAFAVYLLRLRNLSMLPWIYVFLGVGGYLASNVAELVGQRSGQMHELPQILVQAPADTRMLILDLLQFTLRAHQLLFFLPGLAIVTFTIVMHFTTPKPSAK